MHMHGSCRDRQQVHTQAADSLIHSSLLTKHDLQPMREEGWCAGPVHQSYATY